MSDEQNTYGVPDEVNSSLGDVPVTQETQPSPFDLMVEDIAGKLEESKTWPLDFRPNWHADFSIYIDPDELEQMREASRKPAPNRAGRRGNQKGEIDLFRLHRAVLQNQNTGLRFNLSGKPADEATDEDYQPIKASDGHPLTFTHPEFLERVVQKADWGKDITTTYEAVEKFIGPGYIAGLATAVLEAAGFGISAEPLDP
ncbi:hypothetical protein [Nesterenkonia flava]|uniref:Tail assembly chaperone n=1 Tax=Nesterenkonia flava TaxID=469799 RepID=A0ABU1FTD0_9MICC|nr:hypothetical protein [Nesterenkonia flava]MDR5711401.1 hypothetical protein [Nesterenkonia flava]